MPRRTLPRKCIACAALALEQRLEQHAPPEGDRPNEQSERCYWGNSEAEKTLRKRVRAGGEKTWNCPSRIQEISNRPQRNAAQRQRKRRQRGTPEPERPKRLEVPPIEVTAPRYHAQFVRYGSKSRVHAVQAQVYEEAKLVYESDVLHTRGAGNARLERWRDAVKAQIKEDFECGVDGLVTMPRELCPLCREQDES